MSDIRERLKAYSRAIGAWQGNNSAAQCALVREAAKEIGGLRSENVILTNKLTLSTVEIGLLRDGLQEIADNELASGGQLRMQARKLLQTKDTDIAITNPVYCARTLLEMELGIDAYSLDVKYPIGDERRYAISVDADSVRSELRKPVTDKRRDVLCEAHGRVFPCEFCDLLQEKLSEKDSGR